MSYILNTDMSDTVRFVRMGEKIIDMAVVFNLFMLASHFSPWESTRSSLGRNKFNDIQ